MKQSRFTETQILQILKEHENGMPIAELARKNGVDGSTIYNWRSKYTGMSESELKKLKSLETENHRLKKMYADLSLDHAILKDVWQKALTTTERRSTAAYITKTHSISLARACKLIGLSRSVYRYSPKLRDDELIAQELKDLATKYNRYGFKKMLSLLKKKGFQWNHKRIYRVYCNLKLNFKRKPKKRLAKRIRLNSINQRELTNHGHSTT